MGTQGPTLLWSPPWLRPVTGSLVGGGCGVREGTGWQRVPPASPSVSCRCVSSSGGLQVDRARVREV